MTATDHGTFHRPHDRSTDIGGLGMSAHRYNDRIEEIVPVDPTQPTTIAIENQNGDILVRGADRSDVLVRAEKHGNRSSVIYQETHFKIMKIEADDTRIEIGPMLPSSTRGGPAVSVDLDLDFSDLGADISDIGAEISDLFAGHRHGDRDQRRKERRERRGRGFRFKWDSNDVSYEIEIEVPRHLEYRIDVNTASGDVDIRDVTGAINLNTASGDATLSQVAGDIGFHTASGDIRLLRGAGQAVIRSASGDARIERSAFTGFEFHTASGDLHLDAALIGDGPYRIETVSGDSRLAVAALDPVTGVERGLEVTFQSMSGDARLDQKFQRQGSGRWVVAGTEPRSHLAVSTVSGDLQAKLGASSEAKSLGLRPSPRPVAPAPPEPPVPPVPAIPPVSVSPAVPPVTVATVAPAGSAMATGTDEATSAVHADMHDQEPPAESAADRLALLEAVERGEIDIEEALQRLEERKDGAIDPQESV